MGFVPTGMTIEVEEAEAEVLLIGNRANKTGFVKVVSKLKAEGDPADAPVMAQLSGRPPLELPQAPEPVKEQEQPKVETKKGKR